MRNSVHPRVIVTIALIKPIVATDPENILKRTLVMILLAKESVINISQILTIDKSFLTEKISRLPDKKIVALNEGLKLSLSLF